MIMCLQDSDVHVTYEDQQKINLFARTNARLQDLKEELDSKKACCIRWTDYWCSCLWKMFALRLEVFIYFLFEFLGQIVSDDLGSDDLG